MTRTARFVIGLTITLLLLGGLLLWQTEWVEKEVDRGYGEEASRNAFLAAETFLDSHGIATETVVGTSLLDALPATTDLLVYSAPRESLSQRRRDALIEWVENGGSLLVVAHSVFDPDLVASHDALMDELGIFLVSEEDTEDEDVGAEDGEDPDEEIEERKVGDLARAEEAAGDSTSEDDAAGPEALEDDTETLREILTSAMSPPKCSEDLEELEVISIRTSIEVDARLELSSAYELQVYERMLEDTYFSSTSQVIAFDRGEGHVIALTSVTPFTNDRIHCQDHAWFLWYAAEGHPKVWMLHDPDSPSFGELAFAALPASVIGGGMLMILLGAMASIRFGLVPASQDVPRREALEHYEAGVTFQFRKGGFGDLYRRLYEDLTLRAPVDRDAWAERAGLDPSRVWSVISEDVPRSRREILERIRLMLRMRRTR